MWEKISFASLILLIVIIIGLLSNVLNLVIFSHKTFNKNSTFKYLKYLSLIDLIALLVCGTDALLIEQFRFDLRVYSPFFCRLQNFNVYTITHISSMILMLVNIDIVFTVCNKSLGTIFKKIRCLAWILGKPGRIVTVTVGLIVLIDSHFLVFLNLNGQENFYLNKENFTNILGVNSSFSNDTDSESLIIQNLTERIEKIQIDYICYPLRNQKYFYFLRNIWIWIDVLLYSLLPFIVITTCSIIIAIKIKKQSQNFLSRNTNPNCTAKSRRRNRRMLIMLSSTCFFFIICSFPFTINLIYQNFKDKKSYESYQSLLYALAYSHYSFDFIFYFIFVENYRQIFEIIIGKLICKQKVNTKNDSHLKRSNEVELKTNGMKRSAAINFELNRNISDFNLEKINRVSSTHHIDTTNGVYESYQPYVSSS